MNPLYFKGKGVVASGQLVDELVGNVRVVDVEGGHGCGRQPSRPGDSGKAA
jgi:hypothetical protein